MNKPIDKLASLRPQITLNVEFLEKINFDLIQDQLSDFKPVMKGDHNLVLELKMLKDRAKVFQFAVINNMTILEMQHEKINLESIFQEATL